MLNLLVLGFLLRMRYARILRRIITRRETKQKMRASKTCSPSPVSFSCPVSSWEEGTTAVTIGVTPRVVVVMVMVGVVMANFARRRC